MIHDVVMAVVLKICSIFILSILKMIIPNYYGFHDRFKENSVTLYLGQAW